MAASAAAVSVAATAKAVASVATVVRAVRATTTLQHRLRSNYHGRAKCTPSILPPPQDLPVHGPECAEDRLQGFQAVDALRVRARQDRAEPHHCRIGAEAA